MLPSCRTAKYEVWSACERLKIRPPGVKENWDDCSVEIQAAVIAYNQIRAREDLESHGFGL